MENKGYDRNVVILTQPIDYVKHAYKIMPIINASLHRYPKLVDAIARRHEMYNAQTTYVKIREASKDSLVIRPPEALGVGALEKDPLQMQRVYDIGRDVGMQYVDKVKAFLEM